jgi:hypothetical protein
MESNVFIDEFQSPVLRRSLFTWEKGAEGALLACCDYRYVKAEASYSCDSW